MCVYLDGAFMAGQPPPIDENGINDAPVVHGIVPLSVAEDTNLAITGISISDSDAGGNPIQVTLTVVHGTLDIRTDVEGGLTSSDVTGDATGTVTLTGTLVQINATLAAANGLVYRANSNFYGSDTLTVTANDQGHSGRGGSAQDTEQATITVTAVNDLPVFGNAGPTVNVIEEVASILDPDLTVSDVELDARNGGAGDYAGSSFTVMDTDVGGPFPEDVFGFSTAGASFTVNGENLQVGGETFATFTNGNGVLAISFTSSGAPATSALVNEVLQRITYTNTSDHQPDAFTLEYLFAGGSASGTIEVAVTGVDDPPIARDDTFTTTTGVSASVFDDNDHGADVDPEGDTFTVIAVSGGTVGTQFQLPSGALLTLNSDGTFDYDLNGAFDSLPGPESGASNRSVDDTFTYTITGGSTATVTITVYGLEGGNDELLGTAGDDSLFAGSSNDTLDGREGADTMAGGAGDDTYFVDNAGDKVIEVKGNGIDHVISSVSYSLAGQYIERLTLTGTADINATGNARANTIWGNSGDNVINGAGGADSMRGKGGNDLYYVDNVRDKVIEVKGEGIDHVMSSVSYSLGGQDIELLTLTGTADINATGNSLDNTLIGNDGNNVLCGHTGLDTLYGKAGNDRFVFKSAAETGVGETRDVIRDFEDYGDDDIIDLSGFAGTLTFSSADSLSGALNEVIARQFGDHVLIQINTTGGGGADAEILLYNTLRSQISESDFILV